MQNIINLLVGDLVLPPELMFVAACIALCLVVDVFSLIISTLSLWHKL